MKNKGPIYTSKYEDDTLSTPATGSYGFEDSKHIKYPFGKYIIVVKVTSDNKFLGIVEVEVNKDFRSHAQKIASTNFLDVEEYYKDE